MNAPVHPIIVDADATAEALRAAFRSADRNLRQKLVPILPPAVIEFAGIHMYVDPRDNYTDRMIWLDGQPPEMKSLMALTEMVEGKNVFILDIGANCGAFTVPLALAAGAGSRVVAFEPNPVMIGRLGHNLRLNGLTDMVRVESCALGDKTGEGVLNLRAGNYGQATLRPIVGKKCAGVTLVPIRPLMGFVGQAADHGLSVLKIDVEGAEVAVLGPMLDAGGWLPDAMLVETRHAGDWNVDLLAKITALGFKSTLEAEGNTLFVR
jgi:FkbM family methyltransferase